MPSTLRLTIREGCDEPYIDFHVDGKSLYSLILAAPRSGAASVEECLPWHGGDYEVEETVLGEPARTVGLKAAFLFVCGCGYYACGWSVTVDVEVGDGTISFSNFCVDHRFSIDFSPIVFDRRQYEAEVADLTARIAAWKPPPPSQPKPRRVLITPPPPALPNIHPENWPPT